MLRCPDLVGIEILTPTCRDFGFEVYPDCYRDSVRLAFSLLTTSNRGALKFLTKLETHRLL